MTPSASSTPAEFDPENVDRLVFRWNRPLAPGETFGLNYSLNGKYVFASDYDRLLALYRDLQRKKKRAKK